MSEETQAPAQSQEEAPSQPPSWRERVETAAREAAEAADPGAVATEPEPTPPLTQDDRPRDPETGRFIPKEEAATDEPPPEPEADVPHETSEGEEPPEEGVEEEPQAGVTVELPPRQEGDEAFKITVQTEEEAQHLRQLTNGYMRKQEFNRQMDSVRRDQAELNDLEAALVQDPVGFWTQRMAPERQVEAAIGILSTLDKETYGSVVDRLVGWEKDPRQREIEAFQLEKQRYEQARQRESQAQQQHFIQSRVQEIQNAVASLMPSDMSEERRARFFRVASMEIQNHLRNNPGSDFRGEHVQGFLASTGILSDYGLTGAQVSQPAPSAPRPASDRPGAQDSAGMSQQERVERRRNASMTTPPGVGAGASSFQDKPEGMTVDEALKWARKRLMG